MNRFYRNIEFFLENGAFLCFLISFLSFIIILLLFVFIVLDVSNFIQEFFMKTIKIVALVAAVVCFGGGVSGMAESEVGLYDRQRINSDAPYSVFPGDVGCDGPMAFGVLDINAEDIDSIDHTDLFILLKYVDKELTANNGQWAARNSIKDYFIQFIRGVVDLNKQDKSGVSILMALAASGCSDGINAFVQCACSIERSINLDSKDLFGRSALFFALQYFKRDSFTILLVQGALREEIFTFSAAGYHEQKLVLQVFQLAGLANRWLGCVFFNRNGSVKKRKAELDQFFG